MVNCASTLPASPDLLNLPFTPLAPLLSDAGVSHLREAHVVAAPVAGVAEAVLALLGALAAGVVTLGELRVDVARVAGLGEAALHALGAPCCRRRGCHPW